VIRSSAVLRAAAFALVALLSACGGREKPASAAAPATPEASPPVDVNAPPASEAAPLAKATVTIYFPSASGAELIGETREIVDTKRPDDRGAQIIAALLAGPTTDAALPAVPPGTTLRRLWVRDDGNAYADFSDELAAGTTGGSDDEILTVYAIVDSLTSNVPAIRRVAILVAGRERETFGHLDLRRPLPPDLSLTLATKPTE
jgi:spore germination protein GerM